MDDDTATASGVDGTTIDVARFPLHAAAQQDDAAAVEHLIQQGKHAPDEPADGGLTALMCAAVTNAQTAAKQLVERGASVNLQDHDGSTACHLAVANQQHNVSSIRQSQKREGRREFERECVCVCVWERERERERNKRWHASLCFGVD